MKKFDFRSKLKNLSLGELNNLKSYHLDVMLSFIGYDDKEADKHSRYLGYIDDRINKLQIK